jgi:WD40 repeat protein
MEIAPASGELALVDARTVAVASDDGSVSLRDIHDGRETAPKLQSGHNRSGDLAVTPDGSKIALATGDADAANNVSGGAIVVWQRSNRVRTEVPGAVQWSELEYSPDARRLAFLSGVGGDNLAVVDARSGKASFPLISVHSLARTISFVINPGLVFTPDGKLLVVGAVDGPTTIWNGATGKLVRRVGTTRSPTSALAVHPDGGSVAIATRDGHVQLYDLGTGRALGEPLVINGVYATRVAFSDSGDLLAIGARDGGVTLWDLNTHALIGSVLSGHGAQVNGIVFADHDRTLVTGAGDGTVAFRDLDPLGWRRQACAIAGRNLTKAEWRQFLGKSEYRKTCPQWPAGK